MNLNDLSRFIDQPSLSGSTQHLKGPILLLQMLQSLISPPQVFDFTSLNSWNGDMAQVGHKVANHMFFPCLVKRQIPFFSLSKVVCFEDLQALEDVYATIR